MINEIFTTVTQVVTGFAGSLAEAFSSIMAIVWDSTTSKLTTFGILLLIAFGISLVYFALRFVFRLISIRGSK